MSIIKLENVSKSFEGKKVLEDINFSVEEGQSFLILGKSGAGKTVLLKHIIGLIKPDKGKIYIDGADITSLSRERLDKIRLKFGIVFQSSALFDFLTVKENVGFALYRHSDLTYEQIDKEVAYALEMVGLEGTQNLYPYQLSGGMKKRVAIARAIIYRPKIIIYDEPTTGIDPISVDKIVSIIRDLHKRLSITTLIVTHDLAVGFSLAEMCVFISEGRVLFKGRKEDFYKLDDERIKKFIHAGLFEFKSEVDR
ncbi:MAG: hypothetical protein B6D56_00775 [Candidatus Omnitrophica bacterium 4484_70.1]|nr:MAG: hypothetical protein B6D56_00775 [Candidatus Omnitrophica bacterium 4484_70.1]